VNRGYCMVKLKMLVARLKSKNCIDYVLQAKASTCLASETCSCPCRFSCVLTAFSEELHAVSRGSTQQLLLARGQWSPRAPRAVKTQSRLGYSSNSECPSFHFTTSPEHPACLPVSPVPSPRTPNSARPCAAKPAASTRRVP
jgi:hypothetical protein